MGAERILPEHSFPLQHTRYAHSTRDWKTKGNISKFVSLGFADHLQLTVKIGRDENVHIKQQNIKHIGATKIYTKMSAFEISVYSGLII